ncbi:MAG TPA: peptidylprolyl isomerase [Longimicrobiales bacterium]|nr:peptidylprolyl isomerase [Longimicrobiales bacterium]
MANASSGDTVHVHYTGRLEDGTVFDSSEGRDPLEFKLGEGSVIAGFEQAVEGLSVGEKADARLEPEEAYGPVRDDLVMAVPREQLPDGMDPDVGDQLAMQTQDGQNLPVTVVDTDESSVKIDANHPLAGKTLIFELELVDIA